MSANPTGPAPLRGENITLSYEKRQIAENLSLEIADGSFTAIIGPNACGKSTLLRALTGLLSPVAGQVILEGKDIASLAPRQIAQRLGLLPQTATAPEGITVAELVARGRYVHQRLLRQWSSEDRKAVDEALRLTNATDLADRRVEHLSGGQRQRVWIAMVLAQETPLILLDEPTTYLDIAHQMDVLDLLHELNMAGRTIVAVLHDLNHAARYASHIIAMRAGEVIAAGAPSEVITGPIVSQVFGLDTEVMADPVTGNPMVIPHDRRVRTST
ncbi:ABC transporter ATP-binding protein [Roseibium suaedae]|uniref:Iron complex transport system ATP-binding protein n=1 Tax=Roseibium suaedae TaxID=735517 RepID=A0A1M7G0Q1_9HYPH|nr:ABC transporter ATP-binding protein [Roseibium suaedae]SHM09942.1 iron complex transport system ATP-binding protein [Roseibium suaedae]